VLQANNLDKQNPNIIPNFNVNIPSASSSNHNSRDNWTTQNKRNHSNISYFEPILFPQEHPRKNKKIFPQ